MTPDEVYHEVHKHRLVIVPVGERWGCGRVGGVMGGHHLHTATVDVYEVAGGLYETPDLAVEAWLAQWYNDCTASPSPEEL